MMDRRLPYSSETPQDSGSMEGLAAFQAIGLYEQKPASDYSRAALFVSYAFGENPYNQRETAAIANRQLNNLRRSYTFASDDDQIAGVLQDVSVLSSLLSEAVKPLREVFGESTILRLDALASDEDTALRVVVKPSSDVTDAAGRMRRFKRIWWRENIARSRASLSFDYE